MKQLLLLSLGITGFTCVSAQSLSPQVVASAGNSFSSASCRIEFTIGETTTNTLVAGGSMVTQGFHQPEIQVSSIENYNSGFIFTLYPNPTEQFITVECDKENDMQIHIYDANGKSILVSNVFQQKTTVDLQTLAAGTYILNIATKAGLALHSYRVIKK